MTCEKCQKVLVIADWPFCPHPKGYQVAVIDDQLEGGPREIDFGGDEVFVGTKSEWRRALAQRPDLVHVDRHDRAYYQRMFRQHDERLKDVGQG